MLLARLTASPEATWCQVLVVEVMHVPRIARRKCCEFATTSRAGPHSYGMDCGTDRRARSVSRSAESEAVPDGALHLAKDMLERKIGVDFDDARNGWILQLSDDLDLAAKQDLRPCWLSFQGYVG